MIHHGEGVRCTGAYEARRRHVLPAQRSATCDREYAVATLPPQPSACQCQQACDQPLSLRHILRAGRGAVSRQQQQWSHLMTWNTPKIVEVALGAEINCYASADLNA